MCIRDRLSGDIIDSKGWLWSAGVNATFLRSEVKELYGGADSIWYDPTSSDSRAQYVYREGQSTLAFYGYEWAGGDKTNGKNVYYVNDPKNGKAGDFEYNGRGATSVSYTHLDVYKRQLFYSALIAPFYDLFHGGIVIRSLYGLDIVLAVILLGRFPLDEGHV